MQDFCPLCLKSGVKKRLKLLQINLEEAVWACEAEKCVWPFGYEDLIYFPRAVGKTWSCYWDNQKPTIPRTKGTIAPPVELSISNPIVLPSKHQPKEDVDKASSEAGIKSSLRATTDSPKEQMKTCNSIIKALESHAKPPNEEKVLRNRADVSTKNVYCLEDKNTSCTTHGETKDILNGHINKNNSELQFTSTTDTNSNKLEICNNSNNITDTKTGNKKSEIADSIAPKSNNSPEFTNSLKEQINSTLNIQEIGKSVENVSNGRGVPKITSITKVNLNTINVGTSHRVSLSEKLDKNVPSKSKDNNVAEDSSSLLPDIKQTNNISIVQVPKTVNAEGNKLANADFNITTMQVAGLPPITVSYKIPTCLNTLETTTPTTQSNSNKFGTPKNIQPIKRHVTSGKQYAKFTFSSIKKKTETNHSNDVTNNPDDSISIKSSSKDKNIDDDLIIIKETENCDVKKNVSVAETMNSSSERITNTTNTLSNLSTNSQLVRNITNQITDKKSENCNKGNNKTSCSKDLRDSNVTINTMTKNELHCINNDRLPGNTSDEMSIRKTEDHQKQSDENVTSIHKSSNHVIRSLSSNSFVDQRDKIEAVNNIESEPDTSVVNTSVNLDTMLEDFLTNDYSVSEDINDEWLNSLLS